VVEKNCTVCALGASILSKARLFDDYRFRVNDSYEHFHGGAEIFGINQALLIEAAFEQTRELIDDGGVFRDGRTFKFPEGQVDRAVKFGKRYGESEKRLAAIMRNVVKNEGVFVP